MVDIILIASMLIGIILIIISYKSFKKEPVNNSFNYLEIENTIRAIDSSVAEADNALMQINNLSKSVFDEFEEKYQELLFLYSLVDDKKKEVSELYSKPIAVSNQQTAPIKRNPLVSKNPHFDEVMKFNEEGLSVSDISKQLNMGQGEVKLILELGKER